MNLVRIKEGDTGLEAATNINAIMDVAENHDTTIISHTDTLNTHTENLATNTADIAYHTLEIESLIEQGNGFFPRIDALEANFTDGFEAPTDVPIISSEFGTDMLTYRSEGSLISIGDHLVPVSTAIFNTPSTPFIVKQDNAGEVTDFEVLHTGNAISTDAGNTLELGSDGFLTAKPLYSGAGVSTFLYEFETDIANVVGSGKITMNTNDGATATELHFSDTDSTGTSLTWFFEAMEEGDWFNLYLRDDGDSYISFDVTAKPVLDVETWTVTVTPFANTVAEFKDKDDLNVIWRQGGASNVATRTYVDSEIAQLRTEIQELRDYVDSLHPAP